jgi:hypothetical protein
MAVLEVVMNLKSLHAWSKAYEQCAGFLRIVNAANPLDNLLCILKVIMWWKQWLLKLTVLFRS